MALCLNVTCLNKCIYKYIFPLNVRVSIFSHYLYVSSSLMSQLLSLLLAESLTLYSSSSSWSTYSSANVWKPAVFETIPMIACLHGPHDQCTNLWLVIFTLQRSLFPSIIFFPMNDHCLTVLVMDLPMDGDVLLVICNVPIHISFSCAHLCESQSQTIPAGHWLGYSHRPSLPQRWYNTPDEVAGQGPQQLMWLPLRLGVSIR